ncbi:hypothetical protein H4F17_11150 [Vibrio cholerae]
MAKKWTIELKEQVFRLALSYRGPLAPYEEITPDSPSVVAITRQLGRSDVDSRAVLYQLAEMKLFSERKFSKRDGVFHRIPSLDLRWDNERIGPQYPPLSPDEENKITLEANRALPLGRDIIDLCRQVAAKLTRSPRNIHQAMLALKLIQRTSYGEYQPANKLRPRMTKSKLAQFIALKVAPQTQKDEINACRRRTSRLFYLADKPTPAIIFCNDGTGTGKSHGQHQAFIDESHVYNEKGGHNNLFFITPLKSQIDFSKSLVKEARDKGLIYLPFLSLEDVTNLQFQEWVPDELGNFQTNLDRYNRWCKDGGNYGFWKSEMRQLKESIKNLDSVDRQLDFARRVGDEEHQSLLKKQKNGYKNMMRKALDRLALAAINRGEKPVPDLSDMLQNAISKQDKLCAEVLLHIFPFELAKLQPTILVATTKKFDYNIRHIKRKKDGSYTTTSQPFPCIIGGKKDIKDNLAGEYADKSHDQQVEYVADRFLIPDEENIFRQRNISFTVVIDEEHESYQILANSCKVDLLSKERSQLADVMAGVHRIFQSVKGQDEQADFLAPLYEEKRTLIQAISKAIKDECELSGEHTLESIAQLFSNNVGQIFIDSADVEQVVSLAKNVFSFRPKRFFNENALKNIKIRQLNYYTYCQLYYSESSEDTNPSMHDVYQVLLAVLYGASKLGKSSPLKAMLKHGEDMNHNWPLYNFINTAQRVGSDVDYMFQRVKDENLEVNPFFVYFQPKTVFSIEKRQKIDPALVLPGMREMVLVDFSLDLIKEQPEVSLLRMLHDSQNTIICLSATSGIAGNYNGQYDRDFLKEYSKQSSEANHLAYDIITRTSADIADLKALRQERAKLRTVEFRQFGEDSLSIIDGDTSDEFKRVFNFWLNALREHRSGLEHKYRDQEFVRELESVLLAAFDSKHSLIIGRSSQFYSTFKRYLKHIEFNNLPKPKGLKVPDGIDKENRESKRVIELKPFKNGVTVRIIFFDSTFARESDVRHYTRVEDPATKLAFVSHYKGAGTGLNYFVTYPEVLPDKSNFDEDFERLVLITSSFYSQVKTGEGLNSLENFMTLMKHYASVHETKLLKDFDVNLVNGDNYQILMREHAMELLKVLMQAVGRVERRDTQINTEIFLPQDVLNNALMQFANIQRNPENQMMLESMSLLNSELKDFCAAKAFRASFADESTRETFESSMRESHEHLTELFDEFVPETLEKARQGNLDAVAFNEALRHIDCVQNPPQYISRLKQTAVVKADPYIFDVLDYLFIDMRGDKAHITLCRKNGEHQVLTDLTHGDCFYEPKAALFNVGGQLNEDSHARTIIQAGRKLIKEAYKDWVPHPKALAIFKGNVGEYLFQQLLEKLTLQPLSPEILMEQAGSRAYELFDNYLIINNELLCIDVKNWTSTFNKEDMARQSHNKALGKIDTITEHACERFDAVRFIYVNTRLEYNEINTKAETNKDADLYYLNLFKVYEGYPDERLEKRLGINDKLLSLLNMGDDQ